MLAEGRVRWRRTVAKWSVGARLRVMDCTTVSITLSHLVLTLMMYTIPINDRISRATSHILAIVPLH